tara:strand:+ start:1642 stop:1878 length:237 start_codon:yes stop_codon:yes gene_type:complete
MTRLNDRTGLVERKTKHSWRSWWLVKYMRRINLGVLCLPPNLRGKRVRLKLEVMDINKEWEEYKGNYIIVEGGKNNGN